ncbi:MAG TPA: cellulase family glycosylhydrolase [Acidimicrobiia bacterium]|nr:cellulase family glycosylhydrolase [Acidimicrobiia bacterium]
MLQKTRRPLPRLLLLSIAAILVVAGLGCVVPSSSQAPTTVPGSKVGFSVGGQTIWENDADLGHDLDLVASTGAKWVRMDWDWKSVQAGGPTSWAWANTDRIVSAAQARGLSILGVIAYTPTWARMAACSSSMFCPPNNPADYANFARAAAARYAPLGVHDWEIWNEPNLPQWWGQPANAAAYVGILKPAYVAIHGVDPNATVITGGLAPHGDLGATPTDPQSPVNYVQAMYTAGAHGYFDALGLHPYPPLPYDPLSGKIGWNALLQASWIHDIMTSNGDGGAQIWATEYGAPTGPTGYTFTVSPQTQAQYLQTGIRYWNSLSFAGPLFIDTVHDWPTTSFDDWHDNMGVETTDRAPKPAVTALQQLVSNN